MLEVQRLLRDGLTLEQLAEKYALRVTRHERDPLVILNYDQIDSDKRHPVVRECRALTLEVGTWGVVARSFPRFFNAGECPDLEKTFDWENFTAESKEDGSLILLYSYGGTWRVNTRGSFAGGEICPGAGKTWEEAFYDAGIEEQAMDALSEGCTYVFELCTPWNKVVVDYVQPTLFLLSGFHNRSGVELSELGLDSMAELLKVNRPTRWAYASLEEVVEKVNRARGMYLEGVVLRDRKGTRLKVKNPDYVRLHHLKDNGNIFKESKLIPLVLKGEAMETINALPETTEKVFDVVEKLGAAEARMLAVWEKARGLQSQKDFAVFVNKHTPLSAVLFKARKAGLDPRHVLRESEDLVVKQLAC